MRKAGNEKQRGKPANDNRIAALQFTQRHHDHHDRRILYQIGLRTNTARQHDILTVAKRHFCIAAAEDHIGTQHNQPERNQAGERSRYR